MSYQRYSLAAFLACLMLVLTACSGPTSASRAQTSAVSLTDNETVAPKEPIARSAVGEARAIPREARAISDEPRARVARIAERQKPPLRPTPVPPPKEAPEQEAPPAQTAAAAPAPTLTLPAPEPPPIEPPVAPPDVKAVQPEATTRQVKVPSATTVSVRMIDSVDSATGHVGETFKASLESPVIVDNETVFPRGSEVYVKLTKVESAGNLSGRSELQLQLDRIFLGKTSYLLDSSTYVHTGASQGAKTAKTAGIGAAIGAAIGAIAGGGKGAIIGGATGAGAGVGVEAIRKGEQVRVDSESRLDFQLQSPVEVTVRIPSPTNSSSPNSLSGPVRFGTRP
jgi:hypothetical protein